MQSVWQINSTEYEPRKSLEGDLSVNVAIIGGGLFGVLTAYLLNKKGVEATIFEADRIGSGTTGGSTGKITSQHGLIYAKLIKDFGQKAAAEYLKKNETAVRNIVSIVEEEHLDCQLERCNTYIYSTESNSDLEKEHNALRALGFNTQLVKSNKLPFQTQGAIRFSNQATFNPLAFTQQLSKNLSVYEKTRAFSVNGDKIDFDGGTIRANHIVFACRYPFINIPGYYFLRLSQHRSYVIAVKAASDIIGGYMDAAPNGLSFRSAYCLGEPVLLLAGYDDRSGKNAAGGRYNELLHLARKYWPDLELVTQWSAQDTRPIDGVPYIGQFSADTPNWYVATGFNKWGISTSMLAAEAICNQILGIEEGESIFSPVRFKLLPSMKNLAGNAGESAGGLCKQVFTLPPESLNEVPHGQGRIVSYKGEKYAVYKDESGNPHIIPSKCPHLGCRLEWNADDICWECPCHGSTFDVDGNLRSGPATANLKNFD